MASTGHRPPDEEPHHHNLHRDMLNGLLKAPSRPHTPLSSKLRSVAGGSQSGATSDPEPAVEEDPQIAKFRAIYEQAESRIADLFDSTGEVVVRERRQDATTSLDSVVDAPDQSQAPPPTSKKRKLDDDYDDYDDDDEEEEGDNTASPLRGKTNKVHIVADATKSPVARPVTQSRGSSDSDKTATKSKAPPKEDVEDARKKLEATKRAEIDIVKTLSRTMFFTLESDRDAMLDQQRLDDAERRAEAEADSHGQRQIAAAQQGSLSSANLGASSLTLKNLIAQIDQHRLKVHATDTEVRALLSEVRKNRSKWASEDKVGQEELYEAAEKVLNELKAQTEHSTPFLNPVKKKDAPDYYVIIKHPMDLGSMTKKLKQLAYKSKKDFTSDLNQIWKNCLLFNSSPDHLFRKHALFMQKETDKLVPLIPDIVIRDRADVEAEERRRQIADGEIDDGAEESDDEPIMASRGRKAPKKSAKKGGSTSRKKPPETTPVPETKPIINALSSVQSLNRAESEVDGSQGHSTPPPGTLTPLGGPQGPGSVVGAGSEAPDMDLPGLPPQTPPIPEYEDEEYKLWKQKTKKDRAQLAMARHKLFRGYSLNPEEDALLRSKAGMRRWQRIQQDAAARDTAQTIDESDKPQTQGASLSEGLEEQEESMLPDYYDSLGAIPDLISRLRWEQDSQGHAIDQQEEYLRLFPEKGFIAPAGGLTQRMDANILQIQETRKIVSKIGVVKQMQLQSQTYQNQFQKYQPTRFKESDIEKHVMSDAGPIMAPYVCKATLQRTIGKICYHAGFEEFQPSALDALTDMAGDFFSRISTTLANYSNDTSFTVPMPVTKGVETTIEQKPLMTKEEMVLHSIHEMGMSPNEIDAYAREDAERTTNKLAMMHERMKGHLADLLRPALTEDTTQGQGQFTDGGEQYVGGDFAEELDEDFFGFRELGLDKEFGMASLGVPFHILHGRLNTAANPQGEVTDDAEKLFKDPPRWPKITVDNVDEQIGLVRNWLKKKLKENGERPLVEDVDLPPKQRPGYGRPRVPASGKIGGDKPSNASPQKKTPGKPPTKPGQKKDDDKGKKKSGSQANGVIDDTIVVNGFGHDDSSPEKKKPSLKSKHSKGGDDSMEGAVKMNGVTADGDAAMMSPESL